MTKKKEPGGSRRVRFQETAISARKRRRQSLQTLRGTAGKPQWLAAEATEQRCPGSHANTLTATPLAVGPGPATSSVKPSRCRSFKTPFSSEFQATSSREESAVSIHRTSGWGEGSPHQPRATGMDLEELKLLPNSTKLQAPCYRGLGSPK